MLSASILTVLGWVLYGMEVPAAIWAVYGLGWAGFAAKIGLLIKASKLSFEITKE